MLPKLWCYLVFRFFYLAHASFEPCDTVGRLKGDEIKCENFYQCSHRGWVPLNCPDSLVFNDEISVCDWPKPGSKCGRDTNQDKSGYGPCEAVGELKAGEDNCDRFYQCTRHGWTQLTCGHDLTFNPENAVCDWPKPGRQCGGNANSEKNRGNTADQDGDDDAMLEICDSLGQLRADSKNCDRFYQCTRIGWAAVHCQEGFFYNSDISVCDLPKTGTKCDKTVNDRDEHSELEFCQDVGKLKSNEENCQKFYQCTNLGWKELICPDGLFFNNAISVCDWPKSGSKCGEENDSNDDSGYESCEVVGALKAEGDNCELFYQCTKNRWMPLTCGHGLVFNKKISVCDWPKPGPKCGGNTNIYDQTGSRDPDHDDDSILDICEKLGQLKSDPEKCERFFQCTTIGWAPLHCRHGFYFNEKLEVCERSESGARCGGADRDDDKSKLESCKTVGDFKSDDKNCQTFYQCTNDGWKSLTCPDGLFFNPNIRVCDWPEPGSKCETDNSSNGHNNNDDGKYEPCENIGELKEKERNCDRFYQCTRLGWTQLTCGHELTFNPENSVCDWPKPGSKCGGNTNRNDQAGNTDQDEDDAMLEICEELGLLKPDSENCNRFYQCTRIGWAPVHCQEGFYFNQKLSVCDRSSDGSKCRNTDEADDDSAKWESCRIVGDFKLDNENCQKFFQCTNNGWKPLICPEGLFFNTKIQVCDWPQPGSTCETNNSDGNEDTNENHEPCRTIGELKEEERNCDRFYQCTRQGWTELTCGHELTFNPENSVCDWPKPGLKCGGNTDKNHQAGNIDKDKDDAMLEICENLGELKSNAENCDSFYQCTRIGWAPVHCEAGFYFNDKLSICDRSEDGAKCGRADQDDNSKLESCDTVGDFKSDDKNCQKFYQCTNDGWKPLTCPDGLFFNAEIRVCDWSKTGSECGKDNRSDDDGKEDQDKHESCKVLGELKEEERNCDRFYQCTRHGWTELTCGHDLTFNPENSVCDWPKPGLKCGGNNNRNDESRNGARDEDDDAMLEICEKLGQLKPDVENCDRFYQCTRIGWAPIRCEDGFYFNDQLSMCDRSEDGTKCGAAHHDDDSSNLTPCESVGDFKSDEKNCQSFYQCTNNGWRQLTCPDGLVFNEEVKVCDWPKPGFKCGKNNDSDDDHETELDPCENVGEVMADTDHCDLYYRCTSCGWSLVSCESGMLFDSQTLVCDKSYRAKCAAGTDNEHSDDKNHDDHSTNEDHDKNPLEPCQTVSELKVDPRDCNRYYECTNYGWQNMPCYNNLAFNPDKLICDYPYKVDC